MKNNIFKFIIFIFVVLVLIGCNKPDGDQKDPIIYLTTDNFVLYVGGEKEIEFFVDHLEDYNVIYEVFDEEIFKVENGKVVGLKPGTSKLRISLEGYEDIFEEANVKVVQEGSGASPIHEAIMNWVKAEIGTEMYEAKLFPTKHPTYSDAVITYKSSNPNLISDRGLTFASEYDEVATITITINYNQVIYEDEIELTVVGSIPNAIAKDFLGQFYSTIANDVNINYFKDKYPNAKITFRSGNVDVLSNTGKFKKPENDVYFNVYATIEIPSIGYSREYSKNVRGLGLSVAEKAQIIKEDVIDQLNLTDSRIDSDLELPTSNSRYNVTIEWSSSYPEYLSPDGKVVLPLVNTLVELRGTVVIGSGRSSFVLLLEVIGKEHDNTWDTIEEYLDNYIFKEVVKTQKYSVMGVQPAYPAYNDGYVLFYVNEDLPVIEDILPTNHPFRPKTPMTVKYITIHDTAGNGVGADAAMHSQFIKNTERTASSWHYTIDDHELYHHIPNNEVAWHAGDGSGPGNRSSIGIETCTNADGDYDLVILRTAKLVAKLLDDYNLSLANVKQHFDWSGKNCPQVIRGSNRWGELIDLIALELYGRQHLSDVKFEWKSLTPDILADNGMVVNHPGPQTEISYQVTVTYNGETRVYTHTSILEAKK